MSRIGIKIQEGRNKAGFSVKQFSKKLGVAESYISDIETGKKIINETMIRKIEKLLNVTINESVFDETEEPIENLKESVKVNIKENIKETVLLKNVNKQWEDAFSHILKKIPVCDLELKEIFDYYHAPVIDKKVYGYNPEKLVYISSPDDSMRGFRILKGDRILVFKDTEVTNNSIALIELDGKRFIRQLKRLDSTKVLIIAHANELKTETKDVKSVKVIGRCIKMEINFE